ncbi:hypothetical protein LTR91_018213 [Friedmanniomyces endolithicus]|uniref:F-box domain-containing protein n=1 Tax=Friedmanniomyces endolithicus TaxID=329885 RepID=A0AAN6K314_9PEZI|nr:hypothetical protein LTR59_012534 [Friedmanniomyces endolithicus]KAK0786417.1 hypothetical protein LTR38_012018 [Friedmanniomyces endolithicus]KAK0786686.1 hypothetical protein LTR75_013120 [Friedmanniomyces endolithicus]KAK0845308.1 hypothetical protein LTR03_007524 [Friedmanniomyces endolithicus]KAK0859204.1 hypothetical protein LTS02_009389 [Friedmanniomyces endolithicus]
MRQFDQLPADIQKYILDSLPSVRHRIALARTCKAWHRPAITSAYHAVRFACHDASHHSRALAMLSPENAGLKHIRHLMLVPAQAECEPLEVDPAITDVFGLFSYLLPAHTLLSLSIDSCHVLDPDFVAVLHQRQRCLQSLRLDGCRSRTDNCAYKIVRTSAPRHPLIPTDGVGLNENLLQEDSLIDVSHVSHLQIFVSNKWQADWFNIPDLPALTRLEVHVDMPSILRADAQNGDDPQRHLQLSQHIIDDLFGTDGDFHDQLQSLAIRGLDLQEASTALMPILRSRALTSLTLQGCRNITSLIQCCADDQLSLPCVTTLNIATASAQESPCLDLSSLNTLLIRLQGLTHLLLSVSGVPSSQTTVRGLQAEAITQHAETLRFAYLDVASQDPHLFIRGLQSCTKLQQLAIANIGPAPQPFPSSTSAPLESVAMDMLTALKDLRTLHVLDEVAKPDPDGQFANHATYLALRSKHLHDLSTTYSKARRTSTSWVSDAGCESTPRLSGNASTAIEVGVLRPNNKIRQIIAVTRTLSPHRYTSYVPKPRS